VKIVAATNADLRHLVEARQFREDLFYRLNVLSVLLPPLRDRKEDIPALARHFLQRSAEELGKEGLRFSQDAIKKLMNYAWPGNVRELQNVLYRAVAMAMSDVLESPDIDLPEHDPSVAVTMFVPKEVVATDQDGFQAMKAKVIDEFERAYLYQILSTHRGNISQSARAAQKERRAFQRLLYKHGLDRRDFPAA
jgi:DNA-binding NtrC family response regulator